MQPLLLVAEYWEQLKCPSEGEWMNVKCKTLGRAQKLNVEFLKMKFQSNVQTEILNGKSKAHKHCIFMITYKHYRSIFKMGQKDSHQIPEGGYL